MMLAVKKLGNSHHISVVGGSPYSNQGQGVNYANHITICPLQIFRPSTGSDVELSGRPGCQGQYIFFNQIALPITNPSYHQQTDWLFDFLCGRALQVAFIYIIFVVGFLPSSFEVILWEYVCSSYSNHQEVINQLSGSYWIVGGCFLGNHQVVSEQER